MKPVRVQVSASGQLTLPREIRAAIGMERGGVVLMELDGKDIRIRAVAEGVARAQELARRAFAGNPAVSADDFLAHRRRDWG